LKERGAVGVKEVYSLHIARERWESPQAEVEAGNNRASSWPRGEHDLEGWKVTGGCRVEATGEEKLPSAEWLSRLVLS